MDDYDEGRISEDLREELRRQVLNGRLAETEAWLAMMVMLFGEKGHVGYHMRVSRLHAQIMRAEMPRGELAVEIGYDSDTDMYTIDAI
jgi:hypothetical protein